jgi:hypothetical protein
MKKLHLILLILIFLSVSLLTIAKDKSNILFISGDDIGQSYINAYGMCMMEYRTPNIDHIFMNFTVYTTNRAELPAILPS